MLSQLAKHPRPAVEGMGAPAAGAFRCPQTLQRKGRLSGAGQVLQFHGYFKIFSLLNSSKVQLNVKSFIEIRGEGMAF